MQPTPVSVDPPPRDRSIEQLAAARYFLELVGRVADLVRMWSHAREVRDLELEQLRDELRAMFGTLGRAGVPNDNAEHAIAAAVSLLAAERAALVAEPTPAIPIPSGGELRLPPAPVEPARHDGPAAFVLARVRPLLELGEHVAIKIATPRAAVADLARWLRVAALGCGVATADMLSTTIELGAIDLVIVEPPVIPPAEVRRAAAVRAGAELEQLADRERGGARRGG